MIDKSLESAVVVPELQEDRLANERAFIGELVKQDKGRLAMLRRNAGNSLCEARGVAWFHGLLTRHSKRWNDGAYFLIATLFASDKDAINGKIHSEGDFGSTMRALKSKSGTLSSDSSPLDRRFNILLDADFDGETGGELAYRLRQMTKRVIAVKDKSVRINWPQLLYDVKRWNGDRKAVQKRWARSYYAPTLESLEDNQPNQSNNTTSKENS